MMCYESKHETSRAPTISSIGWLTIVRWQGDAGNEGGWLLRAHRCGILIVAGVPGPKNERLCRRGRRADADEGRTNRTKTPSEFRGEHLLLLAGQRVDLFGRWYGTSAVHVIKRVDLTLLLCITCRKLAAMAAVRCMEPPTRVHLSMASRHRQHRQQK